MVKPISLSLTHHLHFLTTTSSRFFNPFSTLRFLSTTPYPLQYELIINRPNLPKPTRTAKPEPTPPQNSSLQSWANDKLTTEPESNRPASSKFELDDTLDKSKRKYYNKRRKRMYGSDSDDDHRRNEEQLVEMIPEVVELRTLHKREEELYMYDAFCYPWEKDKHYKMVYQLEKKYFPNQCLDQAFLKPGQSNCSYASYTNSNANTRVRNMKVGVFRENKEVGDGVVGDDKLVFFDENGKDDDRRNAGSNSNENANARVKSKKVGVFGVGGKKDEVGGNGDDKLMFFEENEKGVEREKEKGKRGVDNIDVSEKKVEEFFKGLNVKKEVEVVEPFFSSRRTGLPPVWDSSHGTVLLINKPKGWTSFTVCGKLRRLVKVKKVGHAGTLDPMATGLLIVCVGKSTKLVDRYQGMVKGYSGVFRLGEATSTWDADSPVIQREPWEHIKDEDIKKSALSFCGEIWQVPPMFSAIKVGGEKLYEKARRGESIELSPRRISIFQFDIERSLDDRQNLIFRVTCSKGTYIRSLCADFGKALGSCAHLTALRRDSIGQYSADDAWDFQELEEAITKTYL